MEAQKHATAIDQENVGRLVQYHFNNAWRIGKLASVNTENIQVIPITGGDEKKMNCDDVRLVIHEAEKPKANKAKPAMPELPAKPKATKTKKPKKEHGRFNLTAAFKKARARMKDPARKKCKHGHGPWRLGRLVPCRFLRYISAPLGQRSVSLPP